MSRASFRNGSLYQRARRGYRSRRPYGRASTPRRPKHKISAVRAGLTIAVLFGLAFVLPAMLWLPLTAAVILFSVQSRLTPTGVVAGWLGYCLLVGLALSTVYGG